MEITKIPKAEIVQSARETLSKIRSNQYDVMDNVTYTLGLIIGTALENGYKLEVNFFESGFNDFVELITQRIKAQYCFVIISIPRNPPLFVLNEIRGICDQAIHSITNIDRTLINKAVIYIVDAKPEHRAEYAVDYATTLL